MNTSLECDFCHIGGAAEVDDNMMPPCHAYRAGSKCSIIQDAELGLDLSNLEHIGILLDKAIQRWWTNSTLQEHCTRTNGEIDTKSAASDWNPLTMMIKTRIALNTVIKKTSPPPETNAEQLERELSEEFDKAIQDLEG